MIPDRRALEALRMNKLERMGPAARVTNPNRSTHC
jgi:hypothetical protein